jgi:hypothetical protein
LALLRYKRAIQPSTITDNSSIAFKVVEMCQVHGTTSQASLSVMGAPPPSQTTFRELKINITQLAGYGK